MKMDRKFVRRRRVALVIALVALVALTYGTRDLCWTGIMLTTLSRSQRVQKKKPSGR